MADLYPRYCKNKIYTALGDSPVTVISGPRQCGKTTLVKSLIENDWQYYTFDNQNTLDRAKYDPIGFIQNLTAKHNIIDEVQRVPEVFLAIKQAVDEDRQSGKFVLTGSANALMLPQVGDSLAGRSEIISLLPLAGCEINNNSSTFFEKVFSGTVPTTNNIRVRENLLNLIVKGGFPEPMTRANENRRIAWHTSYINSIVQKDVRDLGQIERLTDMPKLIKLLCNQVGRLTNYTELAAKIGLSRTTMTKYLTLLQQLYIFSTLPSWHSNLSKRIVKTPKLHIVDTGLLCALKQLTVDKISDDTMLLGALVESYIVCELTRLATFYETPIYFYHYRDKDQVEVDLVIETLTGQVVGIEIKSSATINHKDFSGLKKLRGASGDDFLMGLLLYDGDDSFTLEDNIHAVPMGVLWE